MNLIFSTDAEKGFKYWAKKDKKILVRIQKLLEDIKKTPYSGIGKPEPLKHKYAGTWSRRITQEHRIIYEVKGKDILILQCHNHY